MMYHIGNIMYAAVLVSLAHDATAAICAWPPYLVRAWMMLVCAGMSIVGFGCLFVVVFLWGLWDAIRADRREREHGNG